MANLESIKDFLVRLELNPTRIPTMAEYKKAYREKLKNHPDKGGDTAIFQGITEAALAVWQFITEHQDKQTRPESDKDSALLRNFEVSNNVSYNKGNVVFDIDGSKAQIWIDCLKKRVSPPVELPDKSGFKMKMEQFKIPLVSCKTKHEYGSLSVTVYPNPKSSHPKIMVQGQAYLAFVTLVLPEVIKDMEAPPRPALGAAAAGTTSDQDSGDEDGGITQDTRQQDMLATNSMEQAFHRMELEMVNIRTSLGAKVDAALVNLTKINTAGLETKVESLEQLMKTNLEKTNELNQAITELSSNVRDNNQTINFDESHIEKLATCIAGQPSLSQISTTLSSLRTEVAQSATLQVVQTGVQGLSDSLNTLECQVKDISKKITDTNDSSSRDMTQLRKNSDDSLGMFDAMKKSLETLVNQAVNSERPTSTQPNTDPPRHQTPPTSEGAGPRIRKGIMFSSSIALDIDTQKLKTDFNCDLKVIPTNYVHLHPDSTDPDAYLECMVNKHLAGKGCYDFAILAIGTSDITDMDVVNDPNVTTLTNYVADQTKTIADVAQSLATENNIDIFVVDKPPRYDPPSKDPTGMFAKLSKYSNGVMASTIGMTPRLLIVDQSSLARSSVKARADLYKPDGLHLTPRGLTFYTSNITKSLLECYSDMVPPKQSTRPPSNDQTHIRGDRSDYQGETRRSGQWDRRGGGHQPGNEYGYQGGHPPFYPYSAYPPPPPPGWGRGGNGWGGGERRGRQHQNWDNKSGGRGNRDSRRN